MKRAGQPKRDRPARQKIDEVVCRRKSRIMDCIGQRSDRTMIREKSRSKFCLEPGGDNPCRKSIADSVATGCIPVFFDRAMAMSAYSLFPFWELNKTHILIDRMPFLRREVTYLEQILLGVPPAQVADMQQHLRRHAHAFQYSYEDGPAADAVVTILNGLVTDIEDERDNGEREQCKPLSESEQALYPDDDGWFKSK